MVEGRIKKVTDSKGYSSYRLYFPKILMEDFFSNAEETPVTILFPEPGKIVIYKKEDDKQEDKPAMEAVL